ncbi:MAG: hypothetical protein LC746_15170 [Acidobacteria bacterium]|nr:hypothetical protein [Acidobacteriota bacterium]
MRLRILSLTILAALAAVALPQFAARRASLGTVARAAQDDKQEKRKRYDDDAEFTERDEFRQSYTLAPGAQVRLSGLNGSVDVETSAGSAAEVYVVRSARTREDLDYHKVVVEQTASGLVVRGERDNDHGWRGERHDVRQRVWVKIPRSVELTASGINGRATVGEIDGAVHLSGINGAVEVARARGYTDIDGVNGRVTMTIADLGERGVRVSGVNGHVELRFADAVNADLSVSGVNGAVNADLPGVTMIGNATRTNFRARVGAGGTPITVSGVNGSVRLAPRG